MADKEVFEGWVSIDNLREVSEVELESIKGGKIKFYKELLVKEDEDLAKEFADGKVSKLNMFTAMLAKLIFEWNFTNESKEKYEINVESIRKLPSSFTKEMVKLVTWKSLEELMAANSYEGLKKNEVAK